LIFAKTPGRSVKTRGGFRNAGYAGSKERWKVRATEIKAWQTIDGRPVEVSTSLADEVRSEAKDFEKWLANNPEMLGNDIGNIGRQVPTRSGNIDLLGIDRSGDLIVVELKRDKLPRECLAQAIDYTADISESSSLGAIVALPLHAVRVNVRLPTRTTP
jgi:RecB family endonuclease NucS